MSFAAPFARRRIAAAGCLVFALSLVSTAAATAQDDPTKAPASAPESLAPEDPRRAITDLLAALEAKRFADLAEHFCPDHADQAAEFDVSGLAAAFPGIDSGLILDVVRLDAEITSLEVASQSDDEAEVNIQGTITTGLEAEKLGPFIEAILASTGEDVTPEMVETLTRILTADMESTAINISGRVTVTPSDDGGWVVCGELPGGTTSTPAASPASDASNVATRIEGGGTFIVGSDVAPGTYRSSGPEPGALFCYFARLSGFSGELEDIIANDNSEGPTVVTIEPSDAAFETSSCQPWVRVE
jgi:hypothetical protein